MNKRNTILNIPPVQEKELAKRDLCEVQRAMNSLEHRDKAEVSNMHKLESDYKRKIEDAKAKVTALQKKQKRNFKSHPGPTSSEVMASLVQHKVPAVVSKAPQP